MTARAYYVEGVQLVNCGGELCEGCEQRPAIGRSLKGHAICKRCAGWAAREADELAAEVAAAKQRLARRTDTDRSLVLAVHARSDEHDKARSTQTPERIARRAEILRVTNYARSGSSASLFACGHPRTRQNSYANKAGRKFCRECRAKHRAESKQRLRQRRERAS